MNQPTLFDEATIDNSLHGFVQREAKRMWPASEHCKRSVTQVARFADFADNAQRPLSQFLPRDVHAFVDHLLTTGVTKATANRYMASISKVFNHAVDEQVINSAPRIKFFKVVSERPAYFSDDDVSNIISYFHSIDSSWMADMCLLAVKTGMRKGEILALGDGRAYISDDGQWIYLPAAVTKTSKDRYVPIKHPDANAAARRLVDSLADNYTRKKFEQRWDKCKREYGRNNEHYVFHLLRHTAISRMANDLDINTAVIAEVVGHSNVSTTQRYVHAKDSKLLEISSMM